VIPLYSPPGRPQYNGAIEAGIGALKVRTFHQALRQGRPGEWALADAEAARQQANALGRPWGARGPTPAQRWAARQAVTPAERAAFAASVACLEEEPAAPSPAPPAAAEPAPAPEGGPDSGAAAAAGGAPVEHPAPAGGDEVTKPREQGEPATLSPPRVVPSGAESGSAAASGRAPDRAARRRQAISRALVAHGYLVFTRRRIPPPIRKKKVT
jgi:hypothetical protein